MSQEVMLCRYHSEKQKDHCEIITQCTVRIYLIPSLLEKE